MASPAGTVASFRLSASEKMAPRDGEDLFRSSLSSHSFGAVACDWKWLLSNHSP